MAVGDDDLRDGNFPPVAMAQRGFAGPDALLGGGGLPEFGLQFPHPLRVEGLHGEVFQACGMVEANHFSSRLIQVKHSALGIGKAHEVGGVFQHGAEPRLQRRELARLADAQAGQPPGQRHGQHDNHAATNQPEPRRAPKIILYFKRQTLDGTPHAVAVRRLHGEDVAARRQFVKGQHVVAAVVVPLRAALVQLEAVMFFIRLAKIQQGAVQLNLVAAGGQDERRGGLKGQIQLHRLVGAGGKIVQRLQHQRRGVGRKGELRRIHRRHAALQGEPQPPVQVAIAGGLVAFQKFHRAQAVARREDPQLEIQIRPARRRPQVAAPRRDHIASAADPELLLFILDDGADVFIRPRHAVRQFQQAAFVEDKQAGFFRADPSAIPRVHCQRRDARQVRQGEQQFQIGLRHINFKQVVLVRQQDAPGFSFREIDRFRAQTFRELQRLINFLLPEAHAGAAAHPEPVG